MRAWRGPTLEGSDRSNSSGSSSDEISCHRLREFDEEDARGFGSQRRQGRNLQTSVIVLCTLLCVAMLSFVGLGIYACRQRSLGSRIESLEQEGSLSPPAATTSQGGSMAKFEGIAASFESGPSNAASLYCFMIVLPFGYERSMVRLQKDMGLSVFGCDAHTIFSNESFRISPTAPDGERSIAFRGNMVVGFNTWTWAQYNVRLALNTPVFLRAWKAMLELGLWQQYDWTLKCEADTVFFPRRLQALLVARPLLPDPMVSSASCGNCSSRFGSTSSTTSCADHAQWEQGQGKTCAEALSVILRPPPLDCGCFCSAEACSNPASVYLRNCPDNFYTPDQKVRNKALHGPLEVLSRAAWADLGQGLDSCVDTFSGSFGQWGEDWFLEHCLQKLNVSPVDSFNSLNDMDCDPDRTRDATCKVAAAAFQPYKSEASYLTCLSNAEAATAWHLTK